MRKHRSGNSFYNYFKNLNKLSILLVLLLCACGLVAISSVALSNPVKARCLPIQLFAICVGLVAMVVVSLIDYELFCNFWIPLAIISSCALFVTAIFADTIGGNSNWLSLGLLNIQTSEFTKISFIITISSHIKQVGEGLNKLKNFALICFHFLAYFIPVLLQQDLGSALIYLATFIVIIFVAGLKLRYFVIGGILTVCAVPFLWGALRNDQRQRIIYGFQPELDPVGKGYQPLVARMALGSGEFSGLGYRNGIQTQNQLLPANHTDFVYAVIGEEFGFVGNIIVLILLVALIISLFVSVKRIATVNGKLMCTGYASIILFQMLTNIGMVLGLTPVIGVTLPFVSYGGSSILSLFVGLGLVQSILYSDKKIRTLTFISSRGMDL